MLALTVDDDHPSLNHEELSMRLFSEARPNVVTEPPRMTREQEALGRRPIPVSTIEWESVNTSHFTPVDGLDFLKDVDNLIIQQNIELSDMMAQMESENRYYVKLPRGQTIYYANETSTSFQRNCFGSNRAFSMRLFDATQQEALQFRRRFACGSCCSLFCYLQELEVWVPPGNYIGRISQQFNASKPVFSVYNNNNDVIYRIEGPEAFLGCLLGKNYNFQIFSSDGNTQIGSVIHQWDHIQVAYNLSLRLPGSERNMKLKALLLGAAFLLEYMYFESTKRSGRCRCLGC